MDDWFPIINTARRGRSVLTYSFTREAAGKPIRSERPYAWIDSLVRENELRIVRENSDPLYRGDVRPDQSCAPNIAVPLPDHPPAPRAVTPEARAPTASEHLSSPVTPLPPRLRTYAKRDIERHEAETARATAAREEIARAARAASRLARQQAAMQDPTRRSLRLRRGRIGDSTGYGVFELDQLLRAGHSLHAYIDAKPRPLLDRHNYVIGAAAGGPKGQEGWWRSVLADAEQALTRLYRVGNFTNEGGAGSRVRFGIGFGELYPAPHAIENYGVVHKELVRISASETFNAISGYQNHLYDQFAPKSYANAANYMSELVRRRIGFPAFEHSVFTTSEITFSDGPSLSRKNSDADIDTMEALTVLGSYDHKARGHLIWWEDETVVEMPSGSTVIFPSGTKRFSFAAIAPHETRFLVRQYCNAGVLRWLQKDGRSDGEFEDLASEEEIAAWEARREKRAETSSKLYTKLGDVFVFLT